MDFANVQNKAAILEDLSIIMQDNVETGNLDPSIYASVFELMRALSAEIRLSQKAGCAA